MFLSVLSFAVISSLLIRSYLCSLSFLGIHPLTHSDSQIASVLLLRLQSGPERDNADAIYVILDMVFCG